MVLVFVISYCIKSFPSDIVCQMMTTRVFNDVESPLLKPSLDCFDVYMIENCLVWLKIFHGISMCMERVLCFHCLRVPISNVWQTLTFYDPFVDLWGRNHLLIGKGKKEEVSSTPIRNIKSLNFLMRYIKMSYLNVEQTINKIKGENKFSIFVFF